MLRQGGAFGSLLRTGLTRSLSSLAIKLASAGLTYIGFVVLARTMSAAEYGYFAFGLALATVLAIGAGMGQQTAVMRFHAEDMARKDSAAARTTLRAGSMLTILGSLLVAAALCLYAGIADALRGSAPSWPLYAAALLVLPMALGEYTSAALRTQGSIWTALAPRDVVWRIALPLLALALAAAGVMLTGWGALLLAAGLLLIVVAAQYGLARTERYQLPLGFAGLSGFWRARGKISLWLLLGGFINAAALNADTIVIGALLAPEQAGAYFNAFRTGGLMTLFAFAISLVIAPPIARHFYAGERHKAQLLLAAGTWGGFIFSLLAFLAFVFFGNPIMSLFGESYGDASILLIILAVGFLADAATGPSRSVLMLTGHEKRYAAIFGLTTLISILAQIAVLPSFGVIGVAIVSSLTRMLAYGLMSWQCAVRTGLDPTIFGILRLRTHSGGQDGATYETPLVKNEP